MTPRIGRRAALMGTATLAAASLAAPAIAQEPSGEITLMAFSGVFQDNYVKAVVDPFMRRFPRVRVNYFPAQNSAVMLGTLRAQRAAPQTDVVILDVSIQRVANDEGLFARLDPAQVPNLSQLAELGRPAQEGFGPAVTFDHLTLIYNRDLVNPAPRRWADMWDPRFRGQLAVPAAPDIQGLALTILMTRAGGADYRQTIDPGIARIRELAPSVQTWNPNPDQYTLVINGTVRAAVGWNARSQIFADQSQGRLVPVLPEDGTVFQINTINTVANSRNAAAAQAFLNYAIGTEAQKSFTETMFYAPVNARAEIAPSAIARTAAAPENMARVVPVDWAFVAANRDRWNERWRREVIR